MSGYCRIAPGHPLHGPYHDREYGFPSRDEAVLFERLCLEIMQAGLSWELVLKRRVKVSTLAVGRIVIIDVDQQDVSPRSVESPLHADEQGRQERVPTSSRLVACVPKQPDGVGSSAHEGPR